MVSVGRHVFQENGDLVQLGERVSLLYAGGTCNIIPPTSFSLAIFASHVFLIYCLLVQLLYPNLRWSRSLTINLNFFVDSQFDCRFFESTTTKSKQQIKILWKKYHTRRKLKGQCQRPNTHSFTLKQKLGLTGGFWIQNLVRVCVCVFVCFENLHTLISYFSVENN